MFIGVAIIAIIEPMMIGAINGTVSRLLMRNKLGNVPKMSNIIGAVAVWATRLNVSELWIYLNGGNLN
jgi:hypothetical protein